MRIFIATISALLFLLTSCKNNKQEVQELSKNTQDQAFTSSNIKADTFEATVGEFTEFIKETNYTTTADSFGWSGIWNIEAAKWDVGDNANWKLHDGKTEAPEDMPVVHLSYRDACEYCKWKGGRLPTAKEWDYLAGDTVIVGNVWQGLFPHVDEGLDGFLTVAAPVGKFSANAYGYHDMFGNVWEWTSTWDPRKNARIIKGGSFLCDYNVCQGYIPSRYQTTPDDSGLSHLGVRCVYDL